MAAARRKYILDANCFIDAAHDPDSRAAFDGFCAVAAPSLYLSAVVAAELRAGAGRDRKRLETLVLGPYARRRRVVAPSERSWALLGDTLSVLVADEGLVLREVRRSFIFDILVAASCREIGATLVSRNVRDLERIARVFQFRFVASYPDVP